MLTASISGDSAEETVSVVVVFVVSLLLQAVITKAMVKMANIFFMLIYYIDDRL